MPYYDYKCWVCSRTKEAWRFFSEDHRVGPLCDKHPTEMVLDFASTVADQQVTVFDEYVCPSTGKLMTSRPQRDAELKASGVTLDRMDYSESYRQKREQHDDHWENDPFVQQELVKLAKNPEELKRRYHVLREREAVETKRMESQKICDEVKTPKNLRSLSTSDKKQRKQSSGSGSTSQKRRKRSPSVISCSGQ